MKLMMIYQVTQNPNKIKICNCNLLYKSNGVWTETENSAGRQPQRNVINFHSELEMKEKLYCLFFIKR